VADRNTAAVFVLIRATADVINIHTVGRRAEIEMHAVGIGRGSDHPASLFEAFDHEFVGPWIVEQPLLWKDANFKVDRPGVVLDEWAHPLEAAQPDDRVDLQMGAHVRGALEDRLLQRTRGTRIDVLGRESLFCLGNLPDRFLEIAAVGGAAV